MRWQIIAVLSLSAVAQVAAAQQRGDSLQWIITAVNQEPPRSTRVTNTVGSAQAIAENTQTTTIPGSDGCVLTARQRVKIHTFMSNSSSFLDGSTDKVWRIDLSKMEPAAIQVKSNTFQLRGTAVCSSGDCVILSVPLHSSTFAVTPLSCTSKKGDDESDCLDQRDAQKGFLFFFHDQALASRVAIALQTAVIACGGVNSSAPPQ
jgi:hypothetical protein